MLTVAVKLARDDDLEAARGTGEKPAVLLHDVTTEIHGAPLHRGVNLAVRRGESLGVIGNSGSGKSLLLKSIVGLFPPVSGSIELFGVNVYAASRRALQMVLPRCGVLFQHNALFSMLTVQENVEFPIRTLSGLSERLVGELAQLKIAMAGLPPDAGQKYPSELSGGMEKRAGLARAIANDPELLLLDEPTTGLDPIMAEQIDDLIRRLAQARGITVLLITHDVDTLFGVCDRVAALADGEIVALSSPRELYASRNAWVHRFLTARPRKRFGVSEASTG